MIIVWNQDQGDMYAFKNIKKYKKWCNRKLKARPASIDYVFDNHLWEVNNGEVTDDDNMLEVHNYHCKLAGKYQQ